MIRTLERGIAGAVGSHRYASRRAFCALLPVALHACTAASVQVDAPTAPDGGRATNPNASTFPAFPIDAPTLVNRGGALLVAPVIVSVTWSSDPFAAKLDDFGDRLGPSAYWQTAVGEYGIRAASSDAAHHVSIASALTTFSDADADALVQASANDPVHAHWPAPTANTVYVLYVPPGVDFRLRGQSACAAGVRGYHASAALNDGSRVAYAVVARCDLRGVGADAAFVDITTAASHEIAEAATDPDPSPGAQGYSGIDTRHAAWAVFHERDVENGDLCELYADSFFSSAEVGYGVQRLWSNASFAAGHTPCVPAPASPYFNVTPLGLGTITRTLGSGVTLTERALHVKVGATATFSVGFYSDAPRGDWRLRAIEGTARQVLEALHPQAGRPPATTYAELSIDTATGRNGTTATVTVTPTSAPPRNELLVTLVSTESPESGGSNAAVAVHFYPVLVTTE